MLLPAGSRRFTSRINKAPAVITNQQKNRKNNELVNPTSAVETGSASIPPPIEVPTMSNIPPINFELITKYNPKNSTNTEQNDTLFLKKSQLPYCRPQSFSFRK
ncbi:Uncharacterised protein [Legionella pneumophila]|nr:Uncharacterised protein [Legionella pneumophila]